MTFETIEPAREKGQAIGTIVRAFMQFGKQVRKDAAVEWARKTWGESSPECRAMSATEFTAGGALVPSQLVAEVIELLRARSVFMRAQPAAAPLGDLPRVTGGASVTWVGENKNVPKTEIQVGEVKLAAKTVGGIIPVSNQLLKRGPMVDRFLRDELLAAVGAALNVAGLKGPGTEYQPKGVYYWAPAANKFNSAGTTLAFIRSDFANLFSKLRTAGVVLTRPAIFMAPRSRQALEWNAVDGNGNFAFVELREKGTIAGVRVYDTTAISIVLGGTADRSEVYLVDMADVLVGEDGGLIIKMFDGGAYYDGAQVISGISQNQTVIQALLSTDIGMRHDESVAVAEAVAWA